MCFIISKVNQVLQMNKDSEKLEEGELSDESFEFKEITWKISNALSLPDSVDYKVQSQTFSFAGATWKLLMFPNGQTKYNSKGYIDLMFVRLNSRFPEHSLFYKLCFKTVDGKEFDSISDNGKITTDFCRCGVINYLKKSKVLDEKERIIQNGVLTIMCQMRSKKTAVIDRCSQIESSTSLFGEYKF